jgi:hypothetical protein
VGGEVEGSVSRTAEVTGAAELNGSLEVEVGWEK